jgi:hypothetical protein
MPGLRFAVWLVIMTSLYQSGPVFIQLRGQFLGFHGAAAGTGEHHNIKSGELILGQSKAGANDAFESISIYCPFEVLFRNDQTQPGRLLGLGFAC